MANDEHSGHNTAPTPRGYNWILLAFLAIAGFFLFTEHRAHLLGVLPYLFLLACPLMHLFMHHGHGGHDKQDKHLERSEK
ncbi:MAG: hypothetical protein COT19_02325 [Gallionellales bacterium CG08_land_8_20_14_0_20_59_87]|nr:MAG: hypothetical protein COT19_02325 [Gallionellales bacterium CG08_land_8_20_14_0_20_59_87]